MHVPDEHSRLPRHARSSWTWPNTSRISVRTRSLHRQIWTALPLRAVGMRYFHPCHWCSQALRVREMPRAPMYLRHIDEHAPGSTFACAYPMPPPGERACVLQEPYPSVTFQHHAWVCDYTTLVAERDALSSPCLFNRECEGRTDHQHTQPRPPSHCGDKRLLRGRESCF